MSPRNGLQKLRYKGGPIMKEYVFHELEAERRPKNGYVILGSQVFRIDGGRLYDSWNYQKQ